MTPEALAKQFDNLFWSEKGYSATPTTIKQKNGKVKFKYVAIPGDLGPELWLKHLTTEIGLTPSPMIKSIFCLWGAIDDDRYNLTEGQKLEIIKKCKELFLIPCLSKSGGLQLYAFADEEIRASLMRNRLIKARDILGLDPKTEIFPKQVKVENGEYGNGITTPYRGWFINSKKMGWSGTTALSHEGNKITRLNPDEFVMAIKKTSRNKNFYQTFETYESPNSKNGEAKANEDYEPGSMQDPAIQDMSATELVAKIRKEKMAIDDDSFFDDLVTLVVAKGVGGFATNAEILNPLISLPDTGVDQEYFEKKIIRARTKLDIEDPEISRQKLLKDVIYIKSKDKFFDLTTNDEYRKESIDYTYARLFKKGTATAFIKKNAKRVVVEDWIYEPKKYDPNKKIITFDEKLYLNAYYPNTLKPEEGNIKLWDQLLNHIFTDTMKYKEHFLDWVAYQLQNPGEKIRYACILHSKNFQLGKGSIWRALKECFGFHNVCEIDVKQALDKSKSYLVNSQLVLIDEMQSAGSFGEKIELLNHLKRIITEENIGSRFLYVDYKMIKSCTNYLLFTNHKDALSLPPNDVRYWVYMSEQPRLSNAFYKEYHKWLDAGGAKYILHSLLERDITSEFEPKGVAPETPFKIEMSKAGSHPLTKLLRQMLEENDEPFTEGVEIVSSMQIFNYFKHHNLLARSKINDVANALEAVGARPLGQCRVMIKGKLTRPSLYVIREHEKYIGMQSQKIAESWTPIPEHIIDGKGDKHNHY